ncbi:acyl-CoA thioesterase [Caulobacter soli]|uniref:acyl-CoA thioesterase n=1 Tax=Caulobacter soli TaxID=2708539 RepID=UPI0013E9C103|nr:acyl-CoA thioesterase domain-containing protein [Caulobacter soli]
MNAQPFFDLEATQDAKRWRLPLAANLCVGKPGYEFMFGGVGMAAAIAALERTCEAPAIWATAQYLSYARLEDTVDLDVQVAASGQFNSQARVVGRVGDKEIFTVNAALGQRPGSLSRQWIQAPDAPSPSDCPPAPFWPELGVNSRIEVRLAELADAETLAARYASTGRLLVWMRFREGGPVSASLLAILADYIPGAIAAVLRLKAGGNSLDNTIRFRRIASTEWVLCEIRILGVHGGMAHGAMNLFSEDRELMASASQSMIVRVSKSAAVESD